ncbi:hypothetical protein R3P38DRAFT_890710 [Favolaschia claudopus]|uniref:Uncharacterized protein n=1 Tax=Favolaschia claudopus TaxID=2862362 RepID=A0AAW0BT08_9AGAR
MISYPAQALLHSTSWVESEVRAGEVGRRVVRAARARVLRLTSRVPKGGLFMSMIEVALRNSSTLASAIDSAPPAISIYDINLQREVYVDNPRLYPCWRRRGNATVVRRYHTAEVKNQKEMTVVVYEGKNTEEREVAKYMKFRHPSFLQLYGIVHSGNIHASIFYDALIPFDDIKQICQQSPMLPCYIYASIVRSKLPRATLKESSALSCIIEPLLSSCVPLRGGSISISKSPSSALLPIFLGTGAGNIYYPKCLLSAIDTQVIIDTLTIELYHMICYAPQFTHWTYMEIPLTTTARLSAVYHTTGHHHIGNPVVIVPTLNMDNRLDRAWTQYLGVGPHILESGWNRFRVSELSKGEKNHLFLVARPSPSLSQLWLSQANHVFNCLGVFSNTDNYGLLHSVCFEVDLKPPPARPTDWRSSEGFLFLCPPKSFQVGPASFKCPECVGYWSFDPSGVERLSAEQASELGFPCINISIACRIAVWSDTIYAGLRQFYQGKGFDPNSQDLARYLGHPLYELYSDYEKSLHVDGGEARIEELSSSDTEPLVDEDEAGNLDIGEDEKLESITQNGELDEETVDVSSSLELLSGIQLGLILLLAILGVYGSL